MTKDPHREYWRDCIAVTADEAGIELTVEQIDTLAEGAQGGHENYDMAFYSPPPSDRYDQITRDWKVKYDALQAEFDAYRGKAETAVKKALRCRPDDNIGIGENGEVRLYDGRSDRIQ
jgi:hypothetical protein